MTDHVLDAGNPVVEEVSQKDILDGGHQPVHRAEQHTHRLEEEKIGDVDFAGEKRNHELDRVGNAFHHSRGPDAGYEIALEDECKSVGVVVGQLCGSSTEDLFDRLHGDVLEDALICSRELDGHLHDLLDEAAARSLGVGIALGQRFRDHVLVEGQYIGCVGEIGGELHQLEDGGDLAIIEAIDVIDHDDDAFPGLGDELLELAPLLPDIH